MPVEEREREEDARIAELQMKGKMMMNYGWPKAVRVRYRGIGVDIYLDRRRARNLKHTRLQQNQTTHTQVVYVGLPLPFSGAWTAMFWSAAFGMKFGPSALGALVGVGLSTLVGLALWLTGACVWVCLWLWWSWDGLDLGEWIYGLVDKC